MTRSAARLRAFTMIEVFGVLVLITVMVMLLLPAVQSAREMARRSSCANNLMQLGLAVQGYHASFKQLPMQLSGTDGSTIAGQDNDRRLSFFVGLLPFMGERVLAERIAQPLPYQDDYGMSGYGMSENGMYEYGMEMSMSDDGMDAIAQAGDSNQDESQGVKKIWPAGGPEPFESRYSPWQVEPRAVRCPSDPGTGSPAMGRTNFAACLGDGVVAADSGPFKEVMGQFVVDAELATQTGAAMRGMFVPRVVTRMSDVTDGLSCTILLGEVATGLGDEDLRTDPAKGPGAAVLRDDPEWARTNDLIDLDRPNFWQRGIVGRSKLASNGTWRRGYRWADGAPLYTGFNTILPPNREIVLRDDCDDCWGILPPSSRHQGGANCCFGDGAVRFISDSIEAGQADRPTVYSGSPNPPESKSPYGVWGALGTRAAGELNVYQVGSPVDGQ